MEYVSLDNDRIQLYHADCFDIFPMLDDGSIDLILTDLPYGTTACKWDSILPFDAMWNSLKRVSNLSSPIVLFASQPFTSALVMSNPKMYRHSWVWDKKKCTGGALAKKSPMRSHEDIVVFSKRSSVYFPQMTQWSTDDIKRKRYKDALVLKDDQHNHQNYISPGRNTQVKNGRHPDTIIRIPALGSIDPQRTGHPTQKPVALMEYLIKTYSNSNELVLDFTMGSGTTPVAAINTDRKCIGIEKEKKYFDIAVQRCIEAIKQRDTTP